ncbi:MAG: hypothetical protein V4702_06300 [Patescibacteria group bacterium]
MTSEPKPVGGESYTEATVALIVEQQVNVLGDDNHPAANPYDRSVGIPIGGPRSMDHTVGSDGRLEFGGRWRTHHLCDEDMEIVYAFKPAATMGGEPTAEFLVDEFDSAGLAARTTFVTNEAGTVHKRRVTSFGTGIYDSTTEVSRPLDPSEEVVLKTVIADPITHKKALRELTRLSAEEQQVATDARHDDAIGATELYDRIRAIDEYHTRSQQAAKGDNNPIY